MLHNLLNSTQTLIYLCIALAAFIAVAGSFLFGDHDHDLDHDVDHDHGGGGHELSLFSPKIIFTFMLGFGAAGTIASTYGLRSLWCAAWGGGVGFLMASFAYAIMLLFYKQQATSIIPTSSAIGRLGSVTSAIPDSGVGEIGVDVLGQYQTYLARSRHGKPIPKGARVKVVENQGGQLVVEPETAA